MPPRKTSAKKPAKSPLIKKIKRAVADHLRDVHSGNAGRRAAHKAGPSQAQVAVNRRSGGRQRSG